MLPAYRNMDSYPFQRNQIPFPYFYHPGIETVPPQMRMDPTKSPFPYEHPWPYAGNYGHSAPSHICCAHNSFPGCYSYMPYPHAPVPSPMYFSGGYPSYCEPFCGPYSSQSCYTERPRYEYDKYMPRDHHCCGCPNHVCNKKEGNNVKIEEHEDDNGKKDNDTLVPAQLRNYPYPLVWIPPEYCGNGQPKNTTTAEVEEKEKMVHDKKPNGHENLDAHDQPPQEPRVVWNGWLPFDMNCIPNPNMFHNEEGIRRQNMEADNNRRETEDGRMYQKHQGDDKRSEFPFPIMWLPYFNKQLDGGRTDNQKSNSTPEYIEEVPQSHASKSVPVKPSVDEGVAKKTSPNGVESLDKRASDDARKMTSQRSIPVKQMESHQGKNDYEGSEKKEMSVPLKKVDENVVKGNSQSTEKRGSTSQRNGSKLPPACLRVDPLPRKRNGNGTSRSPSPPASKEKATDGDTSKAPSSSMNEKAKPDLNSQKTPNKVRTIQVTENKTSENKGAECSYECQSQTNMPNGVSTLTKESSPDSDRFGTQDKKEEKRLENMTGEAAEQPVKDTIKQTNECTKKEGRVLLDVDAAVMIQAAYRGYQVRRWDPLKKLKQIDEVSKEVTDVKSRIQAFESSSDLQIDEKEKTATGETIMRLLLKLDTLQGLHPSLREIRKSLARELVTLQEKLDSIMIKKPQQQMQEFDVEKPVEAPLVNGENHQEQEEKVDSSEFASDGSHDNSEKHQDQFCVNDGGIDPLPGDGGSESQLHIDPASNEGMEPTVLPNGLATDDTSPVVPVAALNSTGSICEAEKTAVESDAKSEAENIDFEVDKPDMTALKELPVGVLEEEIIDAGSENQQKGDLDSDMQAMVELPVGVPEESIATTELGKDDETNISKMEIQAENEILVEDLPVGLLDEDTSSSEVLPVEGDNSNANEKTESSKDDNSKETQLEQPLLEEQEEIRSSGKSSDGWVKIEFKNENEPKMDASPNIEEPGEGIDNDSGLAEVCLEAANDEANILPEQEEFVKEPEEKFPQQEAQVDEDIKTLAMEETEKSASAAAVEHDEGSNGDLKLLEENEKLRKLMKELLEAGNEQLSVISNLTGRVKDLEKKLERNRSRRSKRVRTKRHRPELPKSFATVFLNN